MIDTRGLARRVRRAFASARNAVRRFLADEGAPRTFAPIRHEHGLLGRDGAILNGVRTTIRPAAQRASIDPVRVLETADALQPHQVEALRMLRDMGASAREAFFGSGQHDVFELGLAKPGPLSGVPQLTPLGERVLDTFEAMHGRARTTLEAVNPEAFEHAPQRAYVHRACGRTTHVNDESTAAAIGAGEVSALWCEPCAKHAPAREFVWQGTNTQVGA